MLLMAGGGASRNLFISVRSGAFRVMWVCMCFFMLVSPWCGGMFCVATVWRLYYLSLSLWVVVHVVTRVFSVVYGCCKELCSSHV